MADLLATLPPPPVRLEEQIAAATEAVLATLERLRDG